MITISQLLESVDLDFEPRWITKDKNGSVCIFDKKPERYFNEEWVVAAPSEEYNLVSCGLIKLSEFENKHWTECIYEVPRKTSGKIGKLNLLNDSALLWGKKINELVDTVNNIISVQEKMIDSRFVVDAVNELKGANQ